MQVVVCPVADEHEDYAATVADRLRAAGVRVEVSHATDGLGARIRKHKLEKVPHILVVGGDDVDHGTVADNVRGGDKPERDIPVDDVRRAHHRRDPRPHVSEKLDRLWAGWRTSYMDEVTADGDGGLSTEGGSVFTRILRAIDAGDLTDEAAYIVHRGDEAFAILNAYPYGTGHLLVMPYREVGELTALTPAESADVWRLHQRGGRGHHGRLPTRGRQRRLQPRSGGRRRRPDPRPRPRAAPVGRRLQLHDHRRRGPGHARAARRSPGASSPTPGRADRSV